MKPIDNNSKNKNEKFDEVDEFEHEDDEIDIDDKGPKIASLKNNKFFIIGISSVIITVVLYFFFFKKNETTEKVVEVIPQVSNVASSDKSPFELENIPENIEFPDSVEEESTDILAKPDAPQAPALPSLPEDLILPDQVLTTEEQNLQNQSVTLQPAIGTNGQQQLPNLQNNIQNTPQGQESINQNLVPAKPLDPRYSPIIVFSASVQAPSRGVGYDNNIMSLNNDPVLSLEKSPNTTVPTHIADMSHTIAQGKLLSAVIETAINTEIPGFVRGVVSRDVYAESGNEILIPRGSRLFGSYSSKISQGQGRVEIGWTRLIRPDGVDVSINFNASDQFGRSGISGDLDNKYGSALAKSLLTSVLAVGGVAAAQELLSNGDNNTTTTANPSLGTTTTTGNATNQIISDVTRTIIDTTTNIIGGQINTNAVIRIPQGTKITVIVNSDITLPSLVNSKRNDR